MAVAKNAQCAVITLQSIQKAAEDFVHGVVNTNTIHKQLQEIECKMAKPKDGIYHSVRWTVSPQELRRWAKALEEAPVESIQISENVNLIIIRKRDSGETIKI